MSITPVPKRPDWYTADRVDIGQILALSRLEGREDEIWAPVPGVQIAGPARYRVHRSHLPLMTTAPEAARFLLPQPAADRAARDRHTQALGFTLRPWQHSAIEYIQQRHGTLLGDSPRVGKTLSCIMSHDPSLGPFVVICPTMVRPVWINWLQRVFPGETIGVLRGRTFDHRLLQHKLIVGHYEILPWWQSAMPIGTLVFDEAHLLTNRRARRTKAAVFLASRAQRVICATGTPIWNMPPYLWSVLGLVAPGAFGSFYDFANRYGRPVPTAYGTQYTGISNEAELQQRLTEIMLRRRWEDVADNLPSISRNVALVELTESQRRKLDLMTLEIQHNKTKSSTIGQLAKYREKLSTIKADVVIAQARAMLAAGEPVVIWTWHVALARQIAEALTAVGDTAFLLTGETAERDALIDAWRATPAGALVCTMAVAQVGLDFSHAHLAIFAEIDYTPAILAQAEMRTYAPTRPMNITYVIADHLVDQRVVLALLRKLDAANPVGVGAAGDAIATIQQALLGPVEEPDMDRFLESLLEA